MKFRCCSSRGDNSFTTEGAEGLLALAVNGSAFARTLFAPCRRLAVFLFCFGDFAQLALNELLELIGVTGLGDFEGDGDVIRLGNGVGQPVARRSSLGIAEEDGALTVGRGSRSVLNDVALVVGIEGANLVARSIRVDDHQVVVNDGGMIAGRRVFGVIFSHDDFALKSGMKGTIACPRLPGVG